MLEIKAVFWWGRLLVNEPWWPPLTYTMHLVNDDRVGTLQKRRK